MPLSHSLKIVTPEICQVIGRVKINKILNPSAWLTRDTYLKVEAEYVEDAVEDDAGTR